MSDILVISTEGLSAGAPHQNMAAIWLTQRGWNVTLLCPRQGEHDADTPIGKVTMDGVVSRSKFQFYWSFFKRILRHRLAGSKVFYVQGAAATVPAFFALLGVSRSRRIYHTQDFLEPRRHRLLEFFERATARRSGWVIVNEYSRGRFLASAYRLKAIPTVVRTALPLAWPAPALATLGRKSLLEQFPDRSAPQEPIRLITAGGPYSPVRCSRPLMQALAMLPQNYRLVFTGMNPDGPYRKDVAQLADSLGITERIHCLPRMSYPDLLAHFAACDIGILLYPNDGIGNYFQQPGRLTEYMLAGLPFVASDFVGLELTVRKYALGAVADPTSAISIAEGLRSIGDLSYEQREAQKSRLRELARTEFVYESQAPRIESILREALNIPPLSSPAR